MARGGERADPAAPAPPALRRYLNFARLPDPALEVARRVLDDDEEFRHRVAETAEESTVGRGGWLFLHRPAGWQAELEALLQQAAAAEMAAKDERHERGAQRRLAGAEAALARAEATARNRAAEAASARADLRDERLAAHALAEEGGRLRHEVERLSAERADVIRRLKAAEATVVERSAELRAARHEIRMQQAELSGGDLSRRPPAEPVAPATPGLDREQVAAAVAAATGAADRLRSALEVIESLAAGGAGPSSAPTPSTPGTGAGAGTGDVLGGASAPARPPRRQPVRLPPGVFDDAPEAAEHLVRAPRILVLVDGYNISHAQWHGLTPSEQRVRLLGACGELHARVGADIEVVFDGAGEDTTSRTVVRTPVRYRFTPQGVEADDAILARVDDEPPTRPVVVVSSDRRVREGARLRGANVLGARQFLAVLRRQGTVSPSSP